MNCSTVYIIFYATQCIPLYNFQDVACIPYITNHDSSYRASNNPQTPADKYNAADTVRWSAKPSCEGRYSNYGRHYYRYRYYDSSAVVGKFQKYIYVGIVGRSARFWRCRLHRRLSKNS